MGKQARFDGMMVKFCEFCGDILLGHTTVVTVGAIARFITVGNQRSAWDAGCRFDFDNPDYR